jgi:hypothetical protein
MTMPFFSRRTLFLTALSLIASHANAEQDPPKCRYLQAAKLQVRYAGAELQPAIETRIDDSPALMVVDTGGMGNFMTLTGATRRNLPLNRTRLRMHGPGGSARLRAVDLKDFSVGGAHTGPTSMAVAGQKGAQLWHDGFIGSDFLLQFDLEFNLPAKEVRMFRGDRAACADAFLAYWDSQATVVRTELPVRDVPPAFIVELNGVRLWAIIASGEPHSYVDLSAAKRVGLNMDAPSVTRLPDEDGIGPRRIERWQAPFASLSIGGEMIRNPVLYVKDTHGPGADVQLGADFLRSHRVLFAQSQRKLYLTYVGGEPFAKPKGGAPWIRAEADAGNPDAELAVARAYAGENAAEASKWLARAAQHKQPVAQMELGRDLLRARRYREAAEQLRLALDQLPSERSAALWLYVARLHGGEAELGRRELALSFPERADSPVTVMAALRGDEDDLWPTQIADFLLGRISADTLLALAAKQQAEPQIRACEAKLYMAQWHSSRGEEGLQRPCPTLRPALAGASWRLP